MSQQHVALVYSRPGVSLASLFSPVFFPAVTRTLVWLSYPCFCSDTQMKCFYNREENIIRGLKHVQYVQGKPCVTQLQRWNVAHKRKLNRHRGTQCAADSVANEGIFQMNDAELEF